MLFAWVTANKDILVRFGSRFDKPDSKAVAKVRNEKKRRHGKRMFEPAELRTMVRALASKTVDSTEIDTATGKPKRVTLKANLVMLAWVLLGANVGLGQSDNANLDKGALGPPSRSKFEPAPRVARCPVLSPTPSL